MELGQVIVLLLGDHRLQLLKIVTLWGKLIPIQVIKAAFLLVEGVRVGIVRPVGLHESSPSLLALVQALLKLLIEVEH